MKKNRTILFLGLIVILSSWWFLNNGARAAPEAGVLDVWATWGEAPDQLQDLLGRFEARDGASVRVTTRVRSDDLLEALSGPTPPDLVILTNSDLVSAYDAQGLLQPLDAAIASAAIDLEAIFPALSAPCRAAGGRYLCLPWGGDVDALLWNKDLFAAAGLDPERPPQTLEELYDVAARLTQRDAAGELTQVGFIPDFPHTHTTLYARLFGGSSADLTATAPAVSDALAWQVQFYELYAPGELDAFVASFTPYMTSSHPLYGERRLSCQQCHRSTPVGNKQVPDGGFFAGRVAMMIDGQWQVSANATGATFGVGVAPVPPAAAFPARANSAVVGGPVLIIPAGAVDKENAARLLAWMMSPQIVTEAAAAHGTLPATRNAAEDPRFHQNLDYQIFVDLLAGAETSRLLTAPDSATLNRGLREAETVWLHQDS